MYNPGTVWSHLKHAHSPRLVFFFTAAIPTESWLLLLCFFSQNFLQTTTKNTKKKCLDCSHEISTVCCSSPAITLGPEVASINSRKSELTPKIFCVQNEVVDRGIYTHFYEFFEADLKKILCEPTCCIKNILFLILSRLLIFIGPT